MRKTIMTEKISFALVVFLVATVFFAAITDAQTGWEHYQSALELQKNGQLDKSIEELVKSVEAEPDNAFYLNALGLAYIDVGDYDSALENLTRAVQLDKNLPEAYSGLGVCYNAKGKYQNSIDSFEKALELTPENSPDRAIIYNNIGQNYYLLKQFDRAEQALNNALELNDELLTAYINLGNVYTERGDFDTALEYHKKAVEIAPEYPLPRNNLAYAYYKLQDYDMALEEMEKVLEMAPGNERFKENYEFLKGERDKYRESLHEEGVLAGLPKEIKLKDKPHSTPKPAAAPQETPESAEQPEDEPVEVARVPETPTPTRQNTKTSKRQSEQIVEPEPEPEEYTPRPRVRTTSRSHAPRKVVPAKKTIPSRTEKTVAEQPAARPSEPETSMASASQKAMQSTQPDRAAASREEIDTEPAQSSVTLNRYATRKAARDYTDEEPAVAEPQRQPAPVARTASASPPEKPVRDYQRRDRKRGAIYPEEKQQRIEKERELTKPERAESFFEGAKYNIKIGDLHNAQRDIDRALELYPENPDYMLVTGIIQERRGLLHEAANTYRQVIEKAPNHSAAHNSLGHVHELLNRRALAAKEYAKAYSADPTNGCAAASMGTMLVYNGKCGEAMDYLTQAVENKCLKPEVLNNFSLCYFEDGDMENAQQLAYRGLEMDPHNETILANFSYIIEKSGFNYEPIKITLDNRFDPFYKLLEHERDTPLESLTPVEALDYNEVFRNNYHRRTVVVVPFENPRGTERWSPTPSEIKTKDLVNQIRETGYFDVIVPEGNFASMSFSEKVRKDMINDLVEEYDADLVYVGMMKRHRLHDRVNTRFKGLKKTDYVEAEFPIETKIVAAQENVPLYDRELSGTAYKDSITSDVLVYREISKMKDAAFIDYAEKVNRIMLDHYNLVEYPVRHNIVKYVKTSVPKRPAAITR